MNQKRIYLLIGLKGSGKSFIGALMQEEFGIPFIRVEDWAKEVKRNRDVSDDNYVKEVFETIESGVRESMVKNNALVFESTGLTDHFDRMFQSLNQDFDIITIRVQADPASCLERVRSRDQSVHIDISEEQIREINNRIAQKGINTHFKLHNSGLALDQLKEKIGDVIGQRPVV